MGHHESEGSLTASQTIVLQAIRSAPRHFHPDDILNILKKRKIRISRATVYRILEHFIDQGIIKRHWLDQNQFRYELVDRKDHHDHMICLSCGDMFEFFDVEIEAIQQEICEEHRFRPLTHTMLLFGYCARCLARRVPP